MRKSPERVEPPVTSSCTISEMDISVPDPPSSDGVQMYQVQSNALDSRCEPRSSSVPGIDNPGTSSPGCIALLA